MNKTIKTLGLLTVGAVAGAVALRVAQDYVVDKVLPLDNLRLFARDETSDEPAQAGGFPAWSNRPETTTN